MSNTIPNISILPDTVTDIYANAGVIAAGISVGDKINIAMTGAGSAFLHASATPPASIDNVSGYRELSSNEEFVNETGDLGAYIYSRLGCTINVKGVL